MPTVTEIAPDIFRISTYVPDVNLQFNQFLVRDDEPLIFHTGMRVIFPMVKEAVESIIDPTKLRWVVSSHFEADECGALNEWLAIAPNSTSACSVVAASVNIADFANREPRPILDNEVLKTGNYRFKFLQTQQVPHAWDTGLLFEETHRTFLCSDIFHQNGDVEPITESDVVDRAKQAIEGYQNGPFAYYFPYTPWTEPTLHKLAELKPEVCATMHGSAFRGDGARALRDLAVVMKQTLSDFST